MRSSKSRKRPECCTQYTVAAIAAVGGRGVAMTDFCRSQDLHFGAAIARRDGLDVRGRGTVDTLTTMSCAQFG
jgi:hypothetical protein